MTSLLLAACSVLLSAPAARGPAAPTAAAQPRAAAPRSTSLAPTPRPYDARHYDLDLHVDGDGAFRGEVAITLRPSRELASVELDSFGLTVDSATVDGAAARHETRDDAAASTGTLTVRPAHPLAAARDSVLKVAYHGRAGSAHQGFFRVDGAAGAPSFFTHFEPTYARRFYPCDDQTDDKATFTVTLTVARGTTALSVGRLAGDEPVVEDGRELHRVRWVMDQPISTYLLAVAVGPLERVPVDGAPVPAALWAESRRTGRLATASRATAAALADQIRFLGVPFPFARYDQVLVPRFAWGGMENASMTLERESALVDEPGSVGAQPRTTGLIAHELAHQWFGDLVTCRTWGDTWLNEGFATYLGGRTQAALWKNGLADVDRAERLLVSYFREEDGPRSHPLAVGDAPAAEDVFDATSYTKGGAVLRMLESWLGPDLMARSLREYLERHATATASSHDFFADVGRATGKPREVEAFERSWVMRRGYPVLSPSLRWTGRAAELTVRQRPNHPEDHEPYLVRLPVVLERTSAPAFRREVTLVLDGPSVTETIALPAAPEVVSWNAGLTALARVDASALSEAEWIAGALRSSDPLWRLQAAFTLASPMAPLVPGPARSPSAAALDALVAVVAHDPSAYVRAAVMDRLGLAPGRLPAALAGTLREQAEHGLGAPGDEVATVRVRSAALRLLGKVDDPSVGPWLAQGLLGPEVPLDLLGGYAAGAARAGQVSALERALGEARSRGYVYARTVAEGFGFVEGAETGRALATVFRGLGGDNETARSVFGVLDENRALKASPALPSFVRDLVLGDSGFGDDTKARALRLLDDAHTEAARDALSAVAKRAGSQWLRASAERVLEHNFR